MKFYTRRFDFFFRILQPHVARWNVEQHGEVRKPWTWHNAASRECSISHVTCILKFLDIWSKLKYNIKTD